ncbi:MULTISPECIES: hypothetical protein [Burkholderia]|uniref:Uncharacterized protein n=2 Tax=Burkholderia cepacia complex TaxID=87882 RepID=A0AAP1V575_9BURK|nr:MULTISPECIES: hypothetical protein [Burkholderia]MBK1901992.1 hypothetical protein [Burkholderia contaminans]MBK1910275.1 hypothetical protein [Burkholderia contaminans]MBK1923734.1 hypothetical protein [Burkholderia contaminans]MBK1931946.1 hypothetical protein [Burkholderia contaminans]MBK1939195.1 hypothetical protein [Burkholderia contaminans]
MTSNFDPSATESAATKHSDVGSEAPAASIPESVQFYVKSALNALRRHEAALDGVQWARGNGHLLALELKDRAEQIKVALDRLAEFRAQALDHEVDGNAFIQQCGGVPDLSRFGYLMPEPSHWCEHEFAFDCDLSATIRVRAGSLEHAQANLREAMAAASCNAGAWPNGDPILFEASLCVSAVVLSESDGEPIAASDAADVDIYRRPDAEGASLFFAELLASVETLGAIADQYGLNTLTDLMYLHNAILTGNDLEVWPSESEVEKVLRELPSADRWLKSTELGGDRKTHCVANRVEK